MDTTARHGASRQASGFAARLMGARFSVAWLCAFAILCQLLLVQTHVHPAPLDHFVGETHGAAVSGDHAGDTKHKAPADGSKTECFICQQAALAGSVILPDPIEPLLIHREAVAQPVFSAAAVVRPLASHDWRSRGPPIRI